MTTSPRLRASLSPLRTAAILGLLALGACNAIFGIEAGLPGGGSGGQPGTGGAGGGSPSSSTGTSCSSPGEAEFTPRKLVGALSPGSDSASAVVYDAKDNLVVAGLFNAASIDLGKTLPRVSTTDVENGFVVKYDSTGAYLWGQAFGGTNALRFNGAGVDGAGNIFLTGALAGQTKIENTTLTVTSASPNDPDALVVALTPSGAFRWAKRFGNERPQRGHRIAVDADGNSYIAGVSQGQVDFGDGALIGDAGSGWWSFFLKLDAKSNLVWARPFGSWDPNLASDDVEYFEIAVALDGKGHVIVGSTFNAPISFGGGSEAPVGDADAFVASLDAADGKPLWHRTFHQPKGGAAPDGNQWITSLTVDPCSGDIYAAGGFTQGIDFESGGSAKAVGDPDAPDIFVARLAASDGAPVWFKAYGDYGRQDVTTVKVAPDGAVLLNGFLLSSPNEKGIDFGAPGGAFAPQIKATMPNVADVFLLKLDSSSGYLWGLRSGDENPQAAFDVAVDSKGKIATCGIANGTFALGGTAQPVTFSGFHGFVARFDP